MGGEPLFFQPIASRQNVLICQPDNPFDPRDLVNMFEAGVWGIDPVSGVQWTGTFNVEHWRIEDAGLQSIEAKMIAGGAGDWRGTERTLQHFDQEDRSEVLPVVVFHTQVDPVTRVCQSCGRTAGTPRGATS